jgi:hypothetical protein
MHELFSAVIEEDKRRRGLANENAEPSQQMEKQSQEVVMTMESGDEEEGQKLGISNMLESSDDDDDDGGELETQQQEEVVVPAAAASIIATRKKECVTNKQQAPRMERTTEPPPADSQQRARAGGGPAMPQPTSTDEKAEESNDGEEEEDILETQAPFVVDESLDMLQTQPVYDDFCNGSAGSKKRPRPSDHVTAQKQIPSTDASLQERLDDDVSSLYTQEETFGAHSGQSRPKDDGANKTDGNTMHHRSDETEDAEQRHSQKKRKLVETTWDRWRRLANDARRQPQRNMEQPVKLGGDRIRSWLG